MKKIEIIVLRYEMAWTNLRLNDDQGDLEIEIESPLDPQKTQFVTLHNLTIGICKAEEDYFEINRTHKEVSTFFKTETYQNLEYPFRGMVKFSKNDKLFPCSGTIKPYLGKKGIGMIAITKAAIQASKKGRTFFKDPSLRKITDDQARILLERMIPCVQKGKSIYEIQMDAIMEKPSGIGYTYDPKLARKRTDLEVARVIITHHDDMNMAIFRPDVVEVFNQIPVDLWDTCVAFTTHPNTAKQGGYRGHMAKTTLFVKKA